MEELDTIIHRNNVGPGFPADAFVLVRDGTKWSAVRPNSVNLQESPAGFGDTPDEAMNALVRDEGPASPPAAGD